MNLKNVFMVHLKTVVALLIIGTFVTVPCMAGKGVTLISAIKLQDEGLYPQAITEYYKIIENEPHNFKAYYNLAVLIDVVLGDYENAILMNDKSLSITKNKIAFFYQEEGGISEEEIKDFVSKIETSKKVLTERIFEVIENPAPQRYIVLKPGKNIASNVNKNSNEMKIIQNEFRFLNIKDNRYKIALSDTDSTWISNDYVHLIFHNSNQRTKLTNSAKIEKYKNFMNSFPEHELTVEAEKRVKDLSLKVKNSSKKFSYIDFEAAISIKNANDKKDELPTKILKEN